MRGTDATGKDPPRTANVCNLLCLITGSLVLCVSLLFKAAVRCRGAVFPQPAHNLKAWREQQSWGNAWEAALLPFWPVVSAYSGLAGLLERVRMAIVVSTPEINNEVTMGMASAIPGRVSSSCNPVPCTCEFTICFNVLS